MFVHATSSFTIAALAGARATLAGRNAAQMSLRGSSPALTERSVR